MGSHHHKQKIRRRRRLFLRIFCAVTGVLFLFFGTGELFQGSSIIGVALIGTAAVLLFFTFTMRVSKSHH
ncbi:hypothetical protein KJ762_15675 [bacterium]|nr:hypothetical protein [bacterium]MBU1063535.1 hypothetical protein [bacterium]MBU1635925.1 hypothetical protein [bacterium]MBU1875458.1 hypothetical protein [bacterium]